MNTKPGIFISLEGIDGSGKTTQREVIKEYLQSIWRPHTITREPGGTPMAELIRELILRPHDEPVDIVTESLLFYASRKQHIERVIKPHLTAGNVVVSDRFSDSTYSYQYAKGIAPEKIDAIELVAIGNFKPDITFYFDIDIDTSLERANARGKLDRMETEFIQSAQRVIEGYNMRVQADPMRFIIIDAKQSIEDVTKDILAHMKIILQN